PDRRSGNRAQGTADASADRPAPVVGGARRPPARGGLGASPAVPRGDPRMSRAAVLAVDGGNSKTDLALVAADGSVLALVRGPLSSPHHLGIDGALAVLEGLLAEAVREARLSDHAGRVAQVATLLMAGVDFPMEEDVVRDAIEERGWAQRVHVGNDTFAILRAGTERGWGVAVTCGAGSEDGRGPRTSLERAVPSHFGLTTPSELAEAIHAGRIEQRRVIELAPVVLAEAADDAVAAEIVQHLSAEVVALARVALSRLDLL